MKISKKEFLEILKNKERILFKVSNAYCADPEDRKDIIQEMIIQLWKARHKFDPAYKLSTWIYRIALNVAISHYRKSSRRKESPLYRHSNIIDISEERPEDEGIEENLVKLQRFINEFDKLNKALILLYLEEYNYEEIARILGISETNVATKISRLKKKLHNRFKQENTL